MSYSVRGARAFTPFRSLMLAALWPLLGSPAAAEPRTATEPRTDAPSTTPTLEQLSLDAAIARAMKRNPTAQIAALEIERADSLVRQARAGSLPSLTANATVTHLDSDRVMTTGNTSRVVAAQDQLGANLSLQLPLFAPARWALWSHASDNRSVAVESSAEVRRQLATAVARSYLAVVTQHRAIEVAERAVRVSRAHDEYAKTRLQGGVGNRLDAVRSAQQLATNEALLERSRVGLVRATEALGVLVGEGRPVDVAGSVEFTARANEVERALGAEGDAAWSNRQDVRVARAKLKASERVSKDSWLDYLPLLIGQFQPFYQTPATLTQPTTGWQALLLLSLPLYEGGARYGAAREREALKEQSELQVQALMRQCRSELRVAVESVRQSDRALASAGVAAALAKQAETMAVMAYEAGATTNLEVIDAERRTRDAESDVLIAEDTLRQNMLDLLVASGKFPASY